MTTTASTPNPCASFRRTLMRVGSVCAVVELSRPQIYKLVDEGQFPKPVKVNSATLWPSDEIEAWIDARVAARDAAIAARAAKPAAAAARQGGAQ